MQVNIIIFLFLCLLFGVYARIFIYIVIVKQIVFTCVIYATTLYHQSERDIPIFALLESCYDLVRDIPTWFQVLGQILMHILPI